MAMKWATLLTDEVLFPKKEPTSGSSKGVEAPIPIRSNFDRDYDRIIYSTAFRRLGRKTQVHPLSENDHVHNRLSHTLETTTVGRSLGRIIADKLACHPDLKDNLDDDDRKALKHIPNIMVAACLAHDIGNPPFGHSGEDIISEHIRRGEIEFPKLFKTLSDDQKLDLKHFEGNAQTFRILTHLEMYKKEGGLNLTMPTLATTIKYPWGVKGKSGTGSMGVAKFNCYQSESKEFASLVEKLGMTSDDGNPCRHPLSYLLEAADDICYLIMDFEDALDVEIISEGQFKEKLEPLYKKLGIDDDIQTKNPQQIRGELINSLTNRAAAIFMTNYHAIMNGTFKGDLLGNKGDTTLSIANEMSGIRIFFKDNVYSWGRNVRIDIGAYQIIGDLIYYALEKLDTHLAIIQNGEQAKQTKINSKLGQVMGIDKVIKTTLDGKTDTYEAIRMVLDYISGMTDNYAIDMRKTIRGDSL